MKIVFFGTPEYVVPVLESLNKNFSSRYELGVNTVVTQPPKKSGRGNKLEYSEVDHWAHKKNINILFDPKKAMGADIGILAAYGKIIPKKVIDSFRYGIINLHPSLLPKYRGASPIQAVITAGEKTSGMTVIKMDEKLDHGPIVSSFKEPVLPTDTTGSLRERIFLRSADFLVSLVENYVKGKVDLKAQDHKKATYTKTIKKSDSFIKGENIKRIMQGQPVSEKFSPQFMEKFEAEFTPELLERFIRAMSPWPGVWTRIYLNKSKSKQKRLKILSAKSEGDKLILQSVQLEGKREVSWEQFCHGYPQASF